MITFYEIVPDRYFQQVYSHANKIKPCKLVKEISEIESSDVCVCNRIPTMNIPTKSLILMINYNPMVNDLEMFHFSKLNTTHFDVIWLNETYSTYKSYIETVTKRPVVLLPNSWAPLYSDVKYIFGSNKTDIVIVGNHGSWNQSGLKPLLIAESLNKTNPNQIGTIYFMNAQADHEVLLNYIETLSCRSKIRVFINLTDQAIIGHFFKSKNKVVFLTNSVMDEIPPLFYDILYAQYPFVHSLQTLRDKYEMSDYYDNTDLEAAAHKIQHIITTGTFSVCKQDSLTHLMNTDLNKHIAELFVKDSIKDTSLTLKELIANSIVSDILEIENLHQPLVVAYDNNPTENTKAFINTLKHNNWQYMIVGQGDVWEGWSTRLKKYKEVLDILPKDKIVILSDARDVFCVRNSFAFHDGFEAFNSTRDKLVVCGEMICDGRFIEDYNPTKPPIQNKCLDNYWKYYCRPPPLRQFVNNGLVCGRVLSLLEYFVWTKTCGIKDDQLALATYTDLFPEKVVLDTDLGLFHSSVFGHNAGMIKPDAQNTDAPTFAELAGRSVFFLHIPGLRFKGQQRVYDSIKGLLFNGYSDTYLRQDYPYPALAWTAPHVVQKITQKLTLKNIISHVVYINLEERTDRRNKVEAELGKVFSKSQIHRYNAHKHTHGGIGCSLSHTGVIELAKKEKWPNVLVVEDDFIFTETREKGEASFIEHYNKPHDVILLGGTHVRCTKYGKIRNATSCVGYFVESHYYDTLYTNFKEGLDQFIKTNNYPVYACDQYWNRLQIKDNWFITNPMMCYQREAYSDIEKRMVNYEGWGLFRITIVD